MRGKNTTSETHNHGRNRLLLGVCGALSRPILTDSTHHNLRELLASGNNLPLPRLASLNLLEPLYIHHLVRADIEPETVFQFGDMSRLPPVTDFETLARQDYARCGRIDEALSILDGMGVRRVMLVKGAALAPLYPSPALRQMSDADMIVDSEIIDLTIDRFRREGWSVRVHQNSLVCRHLDGFHVDLHQPLSPVARQILDASIPHPEFSKLATMPRPPHHLAFLGYHCALHAGARLWRDVCDLHAILDREECPARAAKEALSFASCLDKRAAPSLAAMFQIMNQFSPRAEQLPGERLAESQPLRRLYLRLAIESTPPIALDLLRSFAVHGLRRPASAKHPGGASPTWAERDPALGNMPPPGTVLRVFRKAVLLGRLTLTGKWHDYRRLLRRQYALAHAPSLFGYHREVAASLKETDSTR